MVYSVTLQPDGGVLVGGGFSNVDGIDRHGIARLHGGGPPRLFNPMFTGHSFSISVVTESGKSYFLECKNSLGETSCPDVFVLTKGLEAGGYVRTTGTYGRQGNSFGVSGADQNERNC